MNIFDRVAMKMVKRNQFDLQHDLKLSMRMGMCVPTACFDVLPGDKFTITPENMLRFMPMVSPVMHRIKVDTHFFFVPNRLIWPEWDRWITGDLEVEAPYITVGNDVYHRQGSVGDYLGYPTQQYGQANIKVSPMPVAAYRLIWDEYYRDQNLQDKRFVPLLPGLNNSQYSAIADIDGAPYRRAWDRDYFTAALPFAQKGDAVQVPLVGEDNIPVEFTPIDSGVPNWRNPYTGAVSPQGAVSGVDTPSTSVTESHIGTGNRTAYDPDGSLTVDVQAGATDINTLRRAFRIQEWLEKNARGGTRYVESILSHFGVKSSDSRLQRPEYIGGSKQNMVISEVLATAQNLDESVPVGQMAGHGISVGGGNSFTYSAEEHGWIIGIISVRPDTAYQQGLHRAMQRFNRLEFAWPSFAQLGEQAIKNIEVYAGHSKPDDTFGYIPMYSEYKFVNSRVAGELKGSLAYWHLGRIFETDQALNEKFIECDPSTRIFAVDDPGVDNIVAYININVRSLRKLPRFGIPTI